MLTNPVRADVLSQGHHLKEDVPRQRTLDTCRNPYLQNRLGTSRGLLSLKVIPHQNHFRSQPEWRTREQTQLIRRVNRWTRGRDPGERLWPQHSFSEHELQLFYLGEEETKSQPSIQKYCCPVRQGRQREPKYTLELIRFSR